MDDYKNLFFIALSIIYFIIQGLSKKKKKGQTPKNSNQPSESSGKTFEQILAELTGAEMKQEAPQPEGPEFEDTTTIIEDEYSLEKPATGYDPEEHDETLKELYEKGEKLKTLNEMVDIESIETKSHFKAYAVDEESNDLAAEIKNDFSNPESVKKAFIYSEIFNRKY